MNKDEVRIKVIPVQVKCKCPSCDDGYMASTEWERGDETEHACDKCGHEEYYGCTYPRIEYQPIGGKDAVQTNLSE